MKIFQKFENFQYHLPEGCEPNKIEMIDEFGNRVFSIHKKYDLVTK